MSAPMQKRLHRAITALDQESIVSPSPADIRRLAPQLEHAVAADLIHTANTKCTATFYGPPTTTSVVHVYKIRRLPGGAVLHRAGVTSPTGSCEAQAALAYAKKRWSLREVCWGFPLYFVVLVQRDDGTVSRLSVVGGIPVDHALAASPVVLPLLSPPAFAQVDAALDYLTVDPIQADELSAGAVPQYLYYCGTCSSEINAAGRCELCDAAYPPAASRRVDWGGPLPPKVVDYLADTHTFRFHPLAAQARAYMDWSVRVLRDMPAEQQPTGRAYQRQRMISIAVD